jgi:hypothetical protein
VEAETKSRRKQMKTTEEQRTKAVLDMAGRIAEAKEIIKELLDFDFLPDIEIKKQAEQFLKDQEEEPCGQ